MFMLHKHKLIVWIKIINNYILNENMNIIIAINIFVSFFYYNLLLLIITYI